MAGFLKCSNELWGALFGLIVYMSCLASSSHLACLLTLRKYLDSHRLTTYLRVTLIFVFAVFLWTAITFSTTFRLLDVLGEYWYLPLLWIYASAVLRLIPRQREQLLRILQSGLGPIFTRCSCAGYLSKRHPTLHATVSKHVSSVHWQLLLAWPPFVVFGAQIGSAGISMWFVLQQTLH